MPDSGLSRLLTGVEEEILPEPLAFRVLEELGIRTPASILLPPGRPPGPGSLAALPGDRVVLKAVAPGLVHKSDVGAVAVVAREEGAIREAVAGQLRKLGGSALRGHLLQEYVPHDRGPGGELLASIRWNEELGPVVGLGPGGLHVETLGALPRSTAFFSGVLPAEDRGRSLAGSILAPLLLEGLRGRPPLFELPELEALLERLLAAGRHFPLPLLEVEINPLVPTPSGPVALDAFVRLGRRPSVLAPPRPLGRIDRLLRPERVGVMGVSRRMNPGRIVVRNLLAQGFPAEHLAIVKPGESALDGCPCYPDLSSVPHPLDLLVVALAAPEVPGVIEEVVATRKAESVIVVPGGLGELAGSEGHVEAMREALAASRGTAWGGPVVNGGNCLGVRSRPGRIDTLFIPRHKLSYPENGETPLALISQSGALTVARASTLWNLDPRYLISVGNQIDLTVGDYLEHLAGDPEVAVFACYVEGFRPGDGARWLAAARRIAASGRIVILYRAGRSREGRAATASHTASFAGPYEVTRELARAAGVLVAETLEDFGDLIRLACGLRDRPPTGLQLGALSNAGFECVAEADHLGSLSLAPLTDRTRDRFRDLLRRCRLDRVVGTGHPFDLTPIADDEAFAEAVEILLGDPTVELGVVGCVPLTGALQTLPPGPSHGEDLAQEDALAARLAALRRSAPKPWVAVVDGGPAYDPFARRLEGAGIPTFRTADRAVRLLGRWAGWHSRFGSE